MSKSSPGPWTYDIHEHSFYIFGPEMAMVADGDPDHIGIARMRGAGRGADEYEQEANARLISQAPNLLAACIETLAFFYSVRAAEGDPLRELQDRLHGPIRARLEAVIAAATEVGGQS